MIRSEFTPSQERGLPKFPALFTAVGDEAGIIVLFSREECGTVVKGNTKFDVGYFSSTWRSCTISYEWEPLRPGESVTLTQG